MTKLIFVLQILISFSSFASVCENRGPNIILFTWDGVRSHEFFNGTGSLHASQLGKHERGEIFSTFWAHHAASGLVLGGDGRYKVGSRTAVSLPSYQALMLGQPTDCTKNKNCPDINRPSVLENIRSQLDLDKKDVAVFASWNRILAAAAQNPANITNGIFPAQINDETMSPEMLDLQAKGLVDLPEWNGSRKDHYTFELGLAYLKKNCPRLLWISLVDSDEWGHEGHYPEYVRSLRQYDIYLDRVIKSLKAMGEYGQNTTLLVSTDHSRGAGPFWKGHGFTKSSEKSIFLFAHGRGVKAQGRTQDKAVSLQIRPTMEYLMGIAPMGEILPNIVVE